MPHPHQHLLPLHLSKAPAPVSLVRWLRRQRTSLQQQQQQQQHPSFHMYSTDMLFSHIYSGVAVGSSIGHAIGGFFGGGSSAPAAEQAQQAPANPADNSTYTSSNYQAPRACETDVSNFRKCMDENQGSLTICGWYLDQLKACQSAASQY